MVMSHVDIVQDANRIVGQHSRRTVERNQIRSDGLAVNPHETDRQAGTLFASQAGLKQSDAPLLSFPDAQQQNLACIDLAADVNFVGGNRWDAASE